MSDNGTRVVTYPTESKYSFAKKLMKDRRADFYYNDTQMQLSFYYLSVWGDEFVQSIIYPSGSKTVRK